jgi:hypothetical protein
VNSCAPCDAAGKTINAYIPTQAESTELQNALTSGGPGDGVFFSFPDGGAKNHCVGASVKVTLRSTYSLPFLGGLPFIGGKFGLNSIKISASSTARIEQNWGTTTSPGGGVYRPGPADPFDRYTATNASPDPC